MAHHSNGHDHDVVSKAETTAAIDDTVNDIRAMASQIREQSVSVIEHVGDNGPPFEQKSHDLMIASVDRIAQQWVGELVAVRDNTKLIEQMVIEHATKVKSELTRLHLLGAQAMLEAQRGNQVLQRLGEELDAMMTERGQSH